MTNSRIKTRSVFLSDLHLGSRDCKAELLLQFLNILECETLYLVGDILDMWQMSKQFRKQQASRQGLFSSI
ncbi:hypothetical protein [Alteromonas flava]|uniref:hypothetical protein n=1 Tax=Alteromonas flava TaxID=2048003 RepID=UPI003B8308EB